MAFRATGCKLLSLRPMCLGEVVISICRISSSGWACGLGTGSLGFSGVVLWLEGVGVVRAGEAFVQALVQVLKALLDLKLGRAQVVGIFCFSLLS